MASRLCPEQVILLVGIHDERRRLEMNGESEHLLLCDAEHIVDALNAAIDLGERPKQRVEYLLHCLRSLLNREDAACSFLLLEDIDRKPAPLVVQRYHLPSPLGRSLAQDVQEARHIVDEWVPLHQLLVPQVLDHLRVPTTIVCSEDSDPSWFQGVLFKAYLQPADCLDLMISSWAASPNRKVDLVVYRHRPQLPFGSSDRKLASLMLRGVGPLVDREMFRVAHFFDKYELTGRQKEVLHELLCGDSEKEIASQFHRSLHTIHSHVKQIYRIFDVRSRGELMAMFVDRRVLELYRESDQSH